MRPLTLDVVGPQGPLLHRGGLDSVVMRRRESLFDPGSEVAILRGHDRLLMQVQPCLLRYSNAEGTGRLPVGQGLLEVDGSQVTLVLT